MKKGLLALSFLIFPTSVLANIPQKETLTIQGKKLTIEERKKVGKFEVLKGCIEQKGPMGGGERRICFPIMKVGNYYSLLIFKREGNKLVPAFEEYKKITGMKIDVSGLEKEIPAYLVVNPRGKETVYVFVDLMCPFCATRGMKELQRFVEEDKRVLIVPFPVHGELSVKAWSCALAELAKGKNVQEVLGKYFKIYRNSKTIEEYKGKLDRICPSDWRRYKKEVEKLQELARKMGVNYVPFIAKEIGKGKAQEVR